MLDPNEYAEIAFLVATSKRRSALSSLVRITGAITGGVFVEAQNFESRKQIRDLIMFPFFLLIIGGTYFVVANLGGKAFSYLNSHKPFESRIFLVSMKAVVSMVMVVIGVAIVVGTIFLLFKVILPNPLWIT